jgi:hypothetical protein
MTCVCCNGTWSCSWWLGHATRFSTVHTGSWQACTVQWQTVCRCAQGSGVERSGAAQGLAEVLGVLGPEYLAGLLPDILATCAAKAAVAREGSLTLFKYLPLAMPDECQVMHPWRRAASSVSWCHWVPPGFLQ